ncbi:MAG: A/G-specific adenine glycosylase, partial [Myxococcota bacterium]
MHLSDCTSVEHIEPLRALGQELVQWFAVHKRTLPWREDRSPYRVWLSEIMLQQTRVATVVPYYERFLARFPEVASLAAAAEDEVLGLWSGLGYYSRGRNLHRAAQVVMDQWGGEFPSTAAELRTLPGVGPYTAAAIASLAFGRMEGVVDGNVLRVLSRLFDYESPVGTPHSHATARSRVDGLIGAAGDPAGINEGLMELGALVCTPRSPACEKCPWQARCLAYARSTVPLRPVKLPKRARTSLRIVCAVVYDEEWVWLEKRPAGGLFGGLHEPPSSPLRGRTTADAAVIS